MKYKSVFDIIGPIMIGPSSSHTAGAVRIGSIARSIFEDEIDEVDIHLFGSFAQTYKGHATDVALVGGLLGFETDDERIVNSLKLAENLGLKVNFIVENALVKHPNTTKLILKNNKSQMSIVAASVGGGSIEILELDGFKLCLKGENNALLIFHEDAFGTIADVTELLAKNSINICHMEVSRTEKGKTALMVIETDELVSPQLISMLNHKKHILKIINLKV